MRDSPSELPKRYRFLQSASEISLRLLAPKKLRLGFDSLTVLVNGKMPIVEKAKGASVCGGVENLPHSRLCSGLSPETRRSSAGVRAGPGAW